MAMSLLEKQQMRELKLAQSKDRRIAKSSGENMIKDESGPIAKGVVESGKSTVGELTQNAPSGAAMGAIKDAAIQQVGGLAVGALGGENSAAGGAASGAMAGAKFGPQGALIGAGLGLAKGVIGARSAKRRAKAKAEAAMHKKKGDIAANRAAGINNSLSGLSGALTATLARR